MVTQQAEQELGGWGLYGRWVVLNLVGWLAGVGIIFAFGWSFGERLRPLLGLVVAETLGFAIGAAIGGALIGAVQGIVLNERGIGYRSWIAATVGGLVLGFVLMVPITMTFGLDDRHPGIVAIFGLLGLCLAAPQWLVARRTLPRAGWWVPAATLGVVLCFAGGFLLGGEGREGIALSAGALAYALVSGLAVVAMFRR